MRQASFLPVFDQSKDRYYVSIPPTISDTGKRKRKYFTDEKEASQFAESLTESEEAGKRLLRKIGSTSVIKLLRIDDELKATYCIEGGLLEVAEREVARLKEENQKSKFGSWLDRYEEDTHVRWGPDSLKAWKRVARHLEPLRDDSVGLLDVDFWQNWMRETSEKRDWNPRTQRDVKQRISSVWIFAMDRRWTNFNPIPSIVIPKEKAKRPAVLTVEQARELMETAWKHDREVVPYFAIAMFAGLRPDVRKNTSEITNLRWEDVDLEAAEIRVAADLDNKTESNRIVKIEPNLVKWLEPWRKAKGPVCPPNLRRRLEYVKWGKYQAPKGTPKKKWKPIIEKGDKMKDVFRHSYGSYFYSYKKDMNQLLINMGHSAFGTFERHYKNFRSEKQAHEYFAILPPD